MRHVSVGTLVTLLVTAAGAQAPQPAAAAFEELVNAERAFVQLAQDKNWKIAFLEYFVEGMRGFEGEDIKADLRKQPDPPAGLEFWWEPRYGDISATGDLGWLTGPVRILPPPDAKGRTPRFSNYASIWKRQRDGRFKVILDVGVNVPQAVPFSPGVTRVPMSDRYSGQDQRGAAEDSLRAADRALTKALVSTSQADAYGRAMAPFARFHRNGVMPMARADASTKWLEQQPPWTSGESRFAEAAAAGDLGYTWGAYSVTTPGADAPERGHYVRVWERDAASRWRLVLDVLQPARSKS